MGKKQKHMGGFAGVMRKWVKPILKASTHTFTVAGVLVASTPVLGGLEAVAHGTSLTEAAIQIKNSAVGTQPGLADTIKSAIVQVGIPVGVGIGLIWAGTQVRKHIGN